MPAKTEDREILNQREIQKSTHTDYPCIGSGDQNDSEIRWIKLHQMFDK
tara:strand:- start:112 stop:258 length:147 start_codon:yes stop_codon:yes gene_type:complete